MKYAITFAPEARDDFRALSAFDRAAVRGPAAARDAINAHILHDPARQSKSRIKRLRDVEKPQYRLRVGDVRVFYDVRGTEVEILAIVAEEDATA